MNNQQNCQTEITVGLRHRATRPVQAYRNIKNSANFKNPPEFTNWPFWVNKLIALLTAVLTAVAAVGKAKS